MTVMNNRRTPGSLRSRRNSPIDLGARAIRVRSRRVGAVSRRSASVASNDRDKGSFVSLAMARAAGATRAVPGATSIFTVSAMLPLPLTGAR